MSKPRYNWWPMVLNIIKDYPQRAKDLKELHQQKIVADNNGMPGGGGASRTAENIATLQLKPQEQREYEAVHKALLRTRAMKGSDDRLKIVRLTMWRGYTIPGAALIVNQSEETTRRYRWQFIMLVGCMYGFITEAEYLAEVKRDFGNEKKRNAKAKNL